jgi:3'(2'), 5'-bisphosphate nucleotidase
MKPLIAPLLAALAAADEAGREILEIYQKHIEVQYKDDRSPLTLADRRSHEIISRRLLDQADHPFPMLSEEGKDIPFAQRKQWAYFWMVDPLDGTKEFIKRNHEFTVNIALIHHDRPVLGVVYVPVRGMFYFGAQGFGAFRLDRKEGLEHITGKESEVQKKACLNTILKRSVRLPVNDSLSEGRGSRLTIVGSRSHPSRELEEFVAKMRTRYKEVEFISAGSALKLCLVAEGRADIYPRLGPTMEWDTAAGQAVVEQAGGRVLDADTKTPLKYNKENLLNPWFIVNGKSLR